MVWTQPRVTESSSKPSTPSPSIAASRRPSLARHRVLLPGWWLPWGSPLSVEGPSRHWRGLRDLYGAHHSQLVRVKQLRAREEQAAAELIKNHSLTLSSGPVSAAPMQPCVRVQLVNKAQTGNRCERATIQSHMGFLLFFPFFLMGSQLS
ncbi:uncharacterized protein LOC133901740 [Phragmites australis]|uniref:uncharacterized protein LOC133901740 n=1 Tax=Phragmites australis TaxID=29695 RepID=UPI002D798F99|nr:uncharacterized protein LOC133901740 [Phragmites australis]